MQFDWQQIRGCTIDCAETKGGVDRLNYGLLAGAVQGGGPDLPDLRSEDLRILAAGAEEEV